MGLFRFFRRKERWYSLLTGFFLMYVSWSFISSQHRIDSLRRGRELGRAAVLPIEERLLLNDAVGRRVQKNISLPFESSEDDEKDDNANLINNEIVPIELSNIHPPVNRHSSPPSLGEPHLHNRDNVKIDTYVPLDIMKTKKALHSHLPRDRAFITRMKNAPYAPEADNVVPNYFIHAEGTNRTRDQYGRTVVTYLHHNKAAGSSVKDCLRKLSSVERKRISLLDAGGRVASINKLKQKPNQFQLYMGGYAFGICKQLSPEPCSYFTFVRDPYERVISSYSYCRRAASDQLCQPGDPWAMNIKEWVLFQGSFLFRQLLFRPEFCKLPRPKITEKVGRVANVPCWYKEKVHLLEHINETAEDELIDYIVLNLDKWFAVIGLTEEYDTSLAMLEEAYGVPFHSKCSGKKINVSDYSNMKNKEMNQTEHDIVVDRTKAELMGDAEVRTALRGDVRIYEQAKVIFEQQRQKYKDIHRL